MREDHPRGGRGQRQPDAGPAQGLSPRARGEVGLTVAVIFTSTRSRDDDAGYDAMSERIESLAREADGFLAIESVRDPVTRRGITVSYWRDDDCARAFKQVAEHLGAQQQGRERWYTDYEVVVAEVTRRYGG